MDEIKNKLIALINQEFALNLDIADFTTPPNTDMGDLALPCFVLAKQRSENPAETAKHMADRLKDKFSFVDKIVATGPYLNFYIKLDYLAEAVITKKLKPIKHKQKIMIEYSQPNTHKEFHVGHLRNVCLGASLVNIKRALGFKVVSANYIGDTGVHVAKCLWGLIKYHSSENLPLNKGQYLGEIYAEASEKLENNPDFKDEVSKIHTQFDAGEKTLVKLWKETKVWSLDSFKNIYKQLDVKFDKIYYESEEEKAGRKLIKKILQENKIKQIKESEGAIIADLREFDLDVLVLIKLNGSLLYGAKDLPLAIKKFDKEKVDISYYIVDNRQSLYLKQIFKLMDLMGYEHKQKFHIAYDFVTLPEGAMASRKGNVVTYESFFEEISQATYAETKHRHADWPEKKLYNVAAKISLAAIKFWMLKYDNNSVITFDIKKALAFDGDTGPYVLYTIARMNSIFKKAKVKVVNHADFSAFAEKSEKDLILKLAEFKYAMLKANKQESPAELAKYAIELAQLFNTFYHNCPILQAEKKVKLARLLLTQKTKKVLVETMRLLNIDVIEEM